MKDTTPPVVCITLVNLILIINLLGAMKNSSSTLNPKPWKGPPRSSGEGPVPVASVGSSSKCIAHR